MTRDFDRQMRDEYFEGRLLDSIDRQGFEASRNLDLGLEVGFTSRDDMIRLWAADRAEVEAQGLDGAEWRRLGLPNEMREDAA